MHADIRPTVGVTYRTAPPIAVVIVLYVLGDKWGGNHTHANECQIRCHRFALSLVQRGNVVRFYRFLFQCVGWRLCLILCGSLLLRADFWHPFEHFLMFCCVLVTSVFRRFAYVFVIHVWFLFFPKDLVIVSCQVWVFWFVLFVSVFGWHLRFSFWFLKRQSSGLIPPRTCFLSVSFFHFSVPAALRYRLFWLCVLFWGSIFWGAILGPWPWRFGFSQEHRGAGGRLPFLRPFSRTRGSKDVWVFFCRFCFPLSVVFAVAPRVLVGLRRHRTC